MAGTTGLTTTVVTMSWLAIPIRARSSTVMIPSDAAIRLAFCLIFALSSPIILERHASPLIEPLLSFN
ncbi:MAG TPA: hypothetical protein VKM55_19445 [Candidatus Lokiarchaeia archaeon]|nr:hypothetical protein [Candidatus Lokiarchaeia archaeon]